MRNDIDFVMVWVDGSDKNWLSEKSLYDQNTTNNKYKDSDIRYRDWGLLKYWFRGVEKFCPWVNKIYFVTWGHIPHWLDTSNPKLKVVKHKDYIPEEFLPTFSSHVIELNLHRIQGLSEKFVYFNDDTLIINKMDQEDFFINNLPCDELIFNAMTAPKYEDIFPHFLLNNIAILNKWFNKNEQIKKNLSKVFNVKYGKEVFRNIALLPWPKYTGFVNKHLPQPFLKSTFLEIWEKEYETLIEVSKHKFRNPLDVNQYLIKNWQLLKGDFVPVDLDKKGIFYELSNDNSNALSSIKEQSHKMICLNDSTLIEDFEKRKEEIIEAFNSILGEKSNFEI